MCSFSWVFILGQGPGVACGGLFVTPGPTTAKLRIIGGHQQMLRLDFEETAPWPLATENRVLAYITDKVIQQQCKEGIS